MSHHNPSPQVALVTGAFSGLGLATTLALARAGWTVYGSGRTMSKSATLTAQAQAAGVPVRVVPLDVTDEDSITAAMRQIERDTGRLDLLVNNAGYALYGAVTEASNAQIRQQFETNIVGAVATSRAALELMRRRGHGRIINISSYLGKVAFPGTGVYSASKFALEALSDAMRLEIKLAGPDYHVIVVEIPAIKTQFSANTVYAEYGDRPNSLYGCFNTMSQDYVARAYRKAPDPHIVAQVIVRAAMAPHPRSRYVVTAQARVAIALRRVLSDRAFDRLLLSQTPRLRRQIEARKRPPRAERTSL